MVARTHALVLAFFLMQTPLPADAQTTPEPIRHTLSFPAPQTNYFGVSSVMPTDGRPEVEVMMAVWTPGSYLIREYSRNVESVTASGQGGRALAIEKSDPAATETSSASGTAG